MNIAVFGGSFDPPHTGHKKIVDKALKNLDIDRLILIPTYINPFKSKFFAPAELRKKWLKKLFGNRTNIYISDYETEKKRAVSTYESIEYIKKTYNPRKIYLIIGSDNFEKLHLWKNYDKLIKDVELVIAQRDEIKIDKNLKKLNINVNISSTKLRESLDLDFIPKIIQKEVKEFYEK